MTFTEYRNETLGKKVRVEYEPINNIYTVFQDGQKLTMSFTEFLGFCQKLTKYGWTQVPFKELEHQRVA